MNNRLIFFFLILLLTSGGANVVTAQNIKLPEGLSLSNQTKYSYDVDLDREIFENWFNADYRYGIFRSGIRFDVFQPNDPNPAISRGKEHYSGVDFLYFKVNMGKKKKGFNFTIGNFYSTFGRGLLIKIYEDRHIRIDNNLLGAKFYGRYGNLSLTAFTGMAENSLAVRKDILHAADLEYRMFRKVRLGFSIASNTPYVASAARTSLLSLRSQIRFWNFDFYGEYAVKQNNDVRRDVFNNSEKFIGKGVYGNLNFYYGKFSLSAELKYYDNFKFTSYDQTVVYNTPPSVTQDYSYILLNRHPHALNQNNEQGYQFAFNYILSDKISLKGNYGMTKSLGVNSYFKRIKHSLLPSSVMFNEAYIQLRRDGKNYLGILAFGYSKEMETSTTNLTPIVELKYYLDKINTIRAILEHQQVRVLSTNEKYYDDAVTLEWLRSPNLTLSLVGEVQTKEPVKSHLVRKFWGFFRIGYNLWDNSEVSLLVGTRQAGNICIGGVCRYEPEFSGVELKFMTRIF